MNTPSNSETRRMVYSLRDLFVLCIGCGLFLGVLRVLIGFQVRMDALSPEEPQSAAPYLLILFWPLPVALVALFRRAPRGELAPVMSSLFLWRVCGLLYVAAFCLVLTVGIVPLPGWAQALSIGVLAVVTFVLTMMGGLAVLEGGSARLYPAAHVVGMLLYLYMLFALPASMLGVALLP